MRKPIKEIKVLPQQDPWSLRPGQHLPLLKGSPSSNLRENHHIFNISKITETFHETGDSKLSSGRLSNETKTTEISRDQKAANCRMASVARR